MAHETKHVPWEENSLSRSAAIIESPDTDRDEDDRRAEAHRIGIEAVERALEVIGARQTH